MTITAQRTVTSAARALQTEDCRRRQDRLCSKICANKHPKVSQHTTANMHATTNSVCSLVKGANNPSGREAGAFALSSRTRRVRLVKRENVVLVNTRGLVPRLLQHTRISEQPSSSPQQPINQSTTTHTWTWRLIQHKPAQMTTQGWSSHTRS